MGILGWFCVVALGVVYGALLVALFEVYVLGRS